MSSIEDPLKREKNEEQKRRVELSKSIQQKNYDRIVESMDDNCKEVLNLLLKSDLEKAQKYYNTNPNFKLIIDAYTKIKDFHENKNLNEKVELLLTFLAKENQVDCFKAIDAVNSLKNWKVNLENVMKNLILLNIYNPEIIEYIYSNEKDKSIKRSILLEIPTFTGALQITSAWGDLNFVEFLIENGVNINNGNALRWASESGQLNIVKYLVQNGANINADDGFALRNASENGHLDVVKILVENGANSNINKALELASENGHFDIFDYLYKKGANFNIYLYNEIVEKSQLYDKKSEKYENYKKIINTMYNVLKTNYKNLEKGKKLNI